MFFAPPEDKRGDPTKSLNAYGLWLAAAAAVFLAGRSAAAAEQKTPEVETETKETEIQIDQDVDSSTKWKRGRGMYFGGLAAFFLASGAMAISHVFLQKQGLSVAIPVAPMLVPFAAMLLGHVCSLYGLKLQEEALIDAGGTLDRNYFRESLGTFLAGAGAGAFLLLAFNLDMIYVSLESMCGDDPAACDRAEQESKENEKVLKGIAIGLAAGQAILLIAVIPMAVMQHALVRKKRLLGKETMAAVPFVSYGFSPAPRAHFVSFTWAF
jgi:hypothetical protein